MVRKEWTLSEEAKRMISFKAENKGTGKLGTEEKAKGRLLNTGITIDCQEDNAVQVKDGMTSREAGKFVKLAINVFADYSPMKFETALHTNSTSYSPHNRTNRD